MSDNKAIIKFKWLIKCGTTYLTISNQEFYLLAPLSCFSSRLAKIQTLKLGESPSILLTRI